MDLFEIPQNLSENSLHLDWSTKETAVRCLRKYFLSQVLNIRSDNGSTALRYGSAWHGAMEAFYKHIKEHGWTRDGGALTKAAENAKKVFDRETELFSIWWDDYRNFDNLMQALLAYINHFAADEDHLKVIEAERRFKLPMEPTEKERKIFPYLKPFWFTGIMDLEVFFDGRYWQMDHKTTGQTLSLQASRLQRSGQSIGYTYAGGRLYDELPEGHLITLHHLSAYKSRTTGMYGKPKIDFQRVPMLYSDGDVQSWKAGFFESAQRIQIAMQSGNWPMEHGSCYTYGRCTYCDICERNLPLDEVIEKVHTFEGYHIGEHWNPAEDL